MREIVTDRNRQNDLTTADNFDRSVVNSTVSLLNIKCLLLSWCVNALPNSLCEFAIILLLKSQARFGKNYSVMVGLFYRLLGRESRAYVLITMVWERSEFKLLQSNTTTWNVTTKIDRTLPGYSKCLFSLASLITLTIFSICLFNFVPVVACTAYWF